MIVAAWNGKEGRGSAFGRDVRELVKTHRPDVIALLEARGRAPRRSIRATTKILYRRPVTGRLPRAEWSSSSLLTAKRIRTRRRGMIRVRAVWYGPKGTRRAGRGFPWQVVELDGRRATIVAVHMPWNATRNPRAWRASWDELERFAKQRPGPILLVGDWNVGAGKELPQGFARRIGATVIRTGAPIDYAIARGLKVAGKTGSSYGSDHPSIVLTVT